MRLGCLDEVRLLRVREERSPYGEVLPSRKGSPVRGAFACLLKGVLSAVLNGIGFFLLKGGFYLLKGFVYLYSKRGWISGSDEVRLDEVFRSDEVSRADEVRRWRERERVNDALARSKYAQSGVFFILFNILFTSSRSYFHTD